MQEAVGKTIGPDGQKHTVRLATPQHLESPTWATLVTAHKILGTTVNTDEVKWARDLRHLLTHQNGELRTEDALTQFRDVDAERDKEEIDRAYVGGKVSLGVSRVLKLLDSLAEVTRAADVPVWGLCWGRTGHPHWGETVTKLHQQKCIVFEPV